MLSRARGEIERRSTVSLTEHDEVCRSTEGGDILIIDAGDILLGEMFIADEGEA